MPYPLLPKGRGLYPRFFGHFNDRRTIPPAETGGLNVSNGFSRSWEDPCCQGIGGLGVWGIGGKSIFILHPSEFILERTSYLAPHTSHLIPHTSYLT